LCYNLGALHIACSPLPVVSDQCRRVSVADTETTEDIDETATHANLFEGYRVKPFRVEDPLSQIVEA